MGTQGVEARDVAKYPAMHRVDPQQQQQLAQNVSSAYRCN